MPMPQLLYFNPDPQVPDADLLGYGDLIYDDGRTEYLAGDPELAMGLSRPPQGAGGLQMPQPADIGNGMQVDAMGNILQGGQPVQPLGGGAFWGEPEPEGPGDPLPVPGQPQNNKFGGFGAEDPTGPALPPAGTVAPDMGGGPQPITVQGEQGPMTISPDGSISPGAGGIPFEQAQQQAQQMGMMPVERQGALPPDVAQRQLGALDASQQQTLGLTEQARRDEARMMNELTLQQLAQNEAMRIQREEEIATEQAKVQRWQQEQQALTDMEIETDLVSAKGAVGAVFAVLGATLLGGAGSDAGLRMIESSIDRHVRQQVARRDTKLGLLSQQIGSSMQAVSLGKAALYKVAADRAELLAQKTKNDVYEAQTPAVVQQLRQKQLENLQAAEQQSMGKLIERVPPPPKPPSDAALQKYGELRRERDASVSIAQRAEREIGLRWVPGAGGEPGHYEGPDGTPVTPQNIGKVGIQGIGNFEQWVPDFVYSTMGGMTSEGYQVRGAAQAMAYAQIRQMQPTGPISNADIQAAVKAGALNTEEGMLQALTRIRSGAEQQQQRDVQEFGADVVGEFERRGQQSGAPNAAVAPAASRRPTIESARSAAAALRKKPAAAPAAGPDATESAAALMEPRDRMAQVAEDLQVIAGQELPPEGLAILVAQAAHESGNGDSQGAAAGNMFGHKRTGKRAGFTANTTEGEGEGAHRTRAEFALYPSIADGVADHLSLIKRRYPRGWEALQAGDVGAYVAALKDGGYFTGNETAYATSLRRML